MSKKIYNTVFILSFVLSVLIVFVSGYGLIIPGFYASENPSWQQQCYGQDLIDLVLIAPLLMMTALLLRNGNIIGLLSWPGIMIYLVYTFLIYCFDVRFNGLFVEYCLILGLSVYSLLYFLYKRIPEEETTAFKKTHLIRLIAIFFSITGIVFYFLWLADIVPAIRSGAVPASVKEAGLPTNPVHVMDLSVILPLFIITAVLLFRNKRMGLILVPYMLIFSILMDITILVLNLLMHSEAGLSVVFGILTLFTLFLFIAFVRQKSSDKNIKPAHA